jgi:probable addiction module antidote protein
MTRFDVIDYLESEEDIAEYLKIKKERSCPVAYSKALAAAARARSILQLAKDTGIDREKLIAMLENGEKPSPRLATKVAAALSAPLHA